MPASVLLIDDDADVLRAVGDYFDRIGYEVGRAETAQAGLEAFDRLGPDVVILDLHLPDVGGLEVLERLRSRGGSVILLTGQGDIETAVRAMQLGAEHFLTKPVDLNHLAAATARVSEKIRLVRQNALLRAREHEDAGLESLGTSPAIRELGRQIELLAARSEEHTSELQSQSNLVCRLLLEKKKPYQVCIQSPYCKHVRCQWSVVRCHYALGPDNGQRTTDNVPLSKCHLLYCVPWCSLSSSS